MFHVRQAEVIEKNDNKGIGDSSNGICHAYTEDGGLRIASQNIADKPLHL